MLIFPTLPPKAGYVEAVDEFGNHYYKPTEETQAQLDVDSIQDDAVLEVGGIVAEQDARMNDLEDAILELADIVGGM